MKFLIDFVKSKNKPDPPIEGAVKTEVVIKFKRPRKIDDQTELTMEAWSIDINTLEELEKIQKESGHRLIISFPKDDKPGTITIYNGYIE